LGILVRRLERCELAHHEFHHEQHLAATAFYVRYFGPDEALNRVRVAIQRFALHVGASRKYNEAITRFWVDQVSAVMQECEQMELPDALEVVLQRLGNKELASGIASTPP
jgi:hypothetical protein